MAGCDSHAWLETPGTSQRTTSSPEAGKAPVAASKADARTVRMSINACYGPVLPVSARRNAGSARQIGGPAISPVRRRVILQELPPHVLAAVEAVDDRVDDARGAVDDVQRRVEAFLDDLARGDLGRVFVGHPTGVDAVHVDAVAVVIGGRGARHPVERGLGHVGVRGAGGLDVAVELAFDSLHVDEVPVARGRLPIRRATQPRLRSSMTLRAAISAWSSSVTQPVSTLFMWMPSPW